MTLWTGKFIGNSICQLTLYILISQNWKLVALKAIELPNSGREAKVQREKCFYKRFTTQLQNINIYY